MIPNQRQWPKVYRLLRPVLLALLLLCVGQHVAAEPVRVVLPDGSRSVAAGRFVEVRWQGLPDEVDEMELLLDIGGRTAQRLRLTPQLVATTRFYLWEVPNLPADDARLRLRWGWKGVEVDGPSSDPFAIHFDAKAPLDSVCFRSGEWWIADHFSTVDRPENGVESSLATQVEEHQPAATPELEGPLSGEKPNRQLRGPTRDPHPDVGRSGQGVTGFRCPVTYPLRP